MDIALAIEEEQMFKSGRWEPVNYFENDRERKETVEEQRDDLKEYLAWITPLNS